MEKIKVFLRLGKRPHPGYYDYINYPPKDIIYKYEKILTSSTQKVSLLHKLKVKLWVLSLKNRPPVIKIDPRGCDIIHSTNNLMNSGKTPWVMDVEHLEGIFGMDVSNVKRKGYFSKVNKTLSSKYCKKLMPHTIASKLSLVSGGLGHLKSKMEVIYPGKKSIPNFEKQSNKVPIILWVGRRFWEKGGNTVLQVFDKLDGKIEFKLIMRGPVPEKLKKKYEGKKNIEFSDTEEYVSSNWRELYKKADIFLYPTNLESLGNAFFDAMNYKVPIVAGDIFSAPEIVKDCVNGFIVNHPFKWHDKNFQPLYPAGRYFDKLRDFYDEKYVSELAEKVVILLKDSSLRRKMGEAGYNEISEGKFSIKERNKKLEKIYGEATNLK
ncbi:glycosyltransferase family 4 protein [Candidatus Pacearchaeota archaeon]|nr:glycosyltransferase family 4 protein [Candidatus Pacearchaeota archaeon]